ncbi:MAG: hypothetical protein WA667_26120 [Candidatus Nitrosopolaris sp.]
MFDKAASHYKSYKIGKYFEEHHDNLMPIWPPVASPEFRVLEECWNISKNDLLVLVHHLQIRIKGTTVLTNQAFNRSKNMSDLIFIKYKISVHH